MIAKKRTFEFDSVFAPQIREYVELRESLGYNFTIASGVLRQFDRHCQSIGCTQTELTNELIDSWIATKGSDSASTRSHRISVLKGFGSYMASQGQTVSWYPIPGYCAGERRNRYIPHIFTADEIRRIFENADLLQKPRGSMFHIVFPAILRVLYGCGLRVSEALAIRVKDINLNCGLITINNTKFDKSRRIPISGTLKTALTTYALANGIGVDEDGLFFPNAKGEMYSQRTVYDKFRTILWRSGIPHQGLGKGPRVHDLRHTFAVHSLQKNIREGKDVYVSLPILASYLGHNGVRSTEYYLRLTAEIYPEFLEKADKLSNMVIPEVTEYEA